MAPFVAFILFSSYFLVELLWWCLYLRRNDIYKFFKYLAAGKRNRKKDIRIVLCVVVSAMLVYPSFISEIRDLTETIIHESPVTCEKFNMPSHNLPLRLVNFVINNVSAYTSYCMFFVVTLLYCLGCVLIVDRWKTTKKTKPRDLWPRCEEQVSFVKDLESFMSLPIFGVICKIGIDVFTLVLMLTSSRGNRGYFISFILTSVQQSTMVICIVFSADYLLRKCRENVARAVRFKTFQKRSDRELEYMTLLKNCELSGWKIFRIRKSFLMTSVTILMSYSLILEELNQKYLD